jgi:hypothetical protein
MRAETESRTNPPLARRESLHEDVADESLTDIIDQYQRRAFQRALERRHANVPYSTVIETARLVRTSSS